MSKEKEISDYDQLEHDEPTPEQDESEGDSEIVPPDLREDKND
jgi:hypothetical protein